MGEDVADIEETADDSSKDYSIEKLRPYRLIIEAISNLQTEKLNEVS